MGYNEISVKVDIYTFVKVAPMKWAFQQKAVPHIFSGALDAAGGAGLWVKTAL